MLDRIDTKRFIGDITGTPKKFGIQFHKEPDFRNFLDTAETPFGPARLDTWVYVSFLVRPEEMSYLYDEHLMPSALNMQRCLHRCARSRALLALTADHLITDVIGSVVGDYPIDHVQGIKVNLTDHDVIDSVVQIDGQRFTVIEYDQGHVYLDPLPTRPIVDGAEVRAGFRHTRVDFSQGGVTVVTAPLTIPLEPNPYLYGKPTEVFETDDFCARKAVSWRTWEVEGQEGAYHFTIDFLAGFIVYPQRCQLVK